MRMIELDRSTLSGQELTLDFDSYAVWEASFSAEDEAIQVTVSRQKAPRKHFEYNVPVFGSRDSRVFGILDNNELRGLAEISGASAGEAARLDTLCVFDGFRRRGLGTLLLSKVKEVLKREGCSSAVLSVSAYNSGAVDFFRKNGFTITGFDPGAGPARGGNIRMSCALR